MLAPEPANPPPQLAPPSAVPRCSKRSERLSGCGARVRHGSSGGLRRAVQPVCDGAGGGAACSTSEIVSSTSIFELDQPRRALDGEKGVRQCPGPLTGPARPPPLFRLRSPSAKRGTQVIAESTRSGVYSLERMRVPDEHRDVRRGCSNRMDRAWDLLDVNPGIGRGYRHSLSSRLQPSLAVQSLTKGSISGPRHRFPLLHGSELAGFAADDCVSRASHRQPGLKSACTGLRMIRLGYPWLTHRPALRLALVTRSIFDRFPLP